MTSSAEAKTGIYERTPPVWSGPGAPGRYFDLLHNLVTRAIKQRYKRSVLGFAWTMLNPLLTMVILTVVFSAVFGTLVNGGEARGGRVGCGAGDFFGGLGVAFRVTDAREGGAGLHELVIQAEGLVDRLDHGDLVVVVVDGEERGEAAAELSEGRAFATEETDAEGVERRYCGGSFRAGRD